MKAAVQGRHDCVTALLLAGADLHAVDPIKGKTAKDWAAFTGRFETTVRIRTLLRRPRAEQFGTRYLPEWPALAGLVAKALSPKSRSQRLSEKIRSLFTFRIPRDPEEDGVLDHMVRMTTSLASPFVSTACRTVCPDSPPEVGKRRLSVAEILQEHVMEPGTGTAPCNGQPVGHGSAGTPPRVLWVRWRLCAAVKQQNFLCWEICAIAEGPQSAAAELCHRGGAGGALGGVVL
uniref:Ankyrin repeat domain 33 n=1 Tax=Pavo cristatus TaxID=9049 RepID=A0A8C9FQP5_PAVCR